MVSCSRTGSKSDQLSWLGQQQLGLWQPKSYAAAISAAGKGVLVICWCSQEPIMFFCSQAMQLSRCQNTSLHSSAMVSCIGEGWCVACAAEGALPQIGSGQPTCACQVAWAPRAGQEHHRKQAASLRPLGWSSEGRKCELHVPISKVSKVKEASAA